jgi:hypothetical protein
MRLEYKDRGYNFEAISRIFCDYRNYHKLGIDELWEKHSFQDGEETCIKLC